MPLKVLNQIKWLCKEIPKVEWSGILFYTIEGTIQDPENMVLNLEDILPMQKGVAAYTEYDFDERVIDYRMENEEADSWGVAHIHSHNTMGVFFSGTDWDELEDNSHNHNIYLSLIVNNYMEFTAKVGFIAEATGDVVYTAKNEKGEYYNYSTEKAEKGKKFIVYDCEIDSPITTIEVEEGFIQKVINIIKTAIIPTHKRIVYDSPRFKRKRITSPSHKPIVPQHHFDWDDPTDTPLHQLVETEVEKMEDLETDLMEEFTRYVLNIGDPIDDYPEIEDVLLNTRGFHYTADALAKAVIDNYTTAYGNFFKIREGENTDDLFIEKLEGVIENINNEIMLTMNNIVKTKLKPIERVLRSLLYNFKRNGHETI